MKPLPAQTSSANPTGGSAMPVLPTVLAPTTGTYSSSNRKTSAYPVQRAYPWLLCTSTAAAGLFCLMYITKPVIVAAPSGNPKEPVTASADVQLSEKLSATTPHADLMPNGNRLPGEKSSTTAAASNRPQPSSPRQLKSHSESSTPFEETNLRIQHILTAEAPGGNVARIDIEVPVIYQSRNLRWTASEVAEARELLIRLSDYQEKSQMLRAEGIELLDSWNRIVERSIPSGELRADSPTLPINQQDSADAPRPAGLSTTESIQIQPAGK